MAAPTTAPLLAGQEMDVNCPSCGGGNRIHFPPGANAIMVKCGSCGTDFQAEGAPPPTSLPPPVAPATVPAAMPVAMPVSAPMAMAVPQQSAMMAPQYAQPMSVPMAQPVVQQQGQMNAQVMPAQMMMLPNQTVRCTCPNCHQVVQSAVTHEIGAGGWVMCAGGCFFTSGVCFCLYLLPCCMSELQDAHHRCPQCNAQIGTKKFLF